MIDSAKNKFLHNHAKEVIDRLLAGETVTEVCAGNEVWRHKLLPNLYTQDARFDAAYKLAQQVRPIDIFSVELDSAPLRDLAGFHRMVVLDLFDEFYGQFLSTPA